METRVSDGRPVVRRSALLALAPLLAAVLAGPAGPATAAHAQDALDRSPNISGGWVGIPWTLHVELPHRFHDERRGDGVDLASTTTFTGALGLPYRSVAGVAYAMQSPTVPGERDEVEAFVRHRLLDASASFADLALTGAWNVAAGSLDAEALLARRLGPVRLLGAARWFSDARGAEGSRAALAGGAVWHPLPRTAPIALAGDLATPLDRKSGEELAWSAGVQVGLPHTALTLSLQASNTAATTLQGRSLTTGGTRYGFELTLPVPAGFFVGGYPAREAAMEAVTEDGDGAPAAAVEIRRYAYGPVRVVVEVGSVVEWVNRDDVVHTATAEDNAWDSGAIRPGESWRARFDEPGIYPYYCGPHPFMKGVVVVRE